MYYTQRHPEEEASFISKVTFFWLIDLFQFGHNNQLTVNDIYRVRCCDASGNVSKEFSIAWNDELRNNKNNSERASLWRVIRKIYGCKVAIGGLIFSIVDTVCRIAQPQYLGSFIACFMSSQTNLSTKHAFYYAAGTIICSLMPVLVFHPFFMYVLNIGQRIRVACCSLLYQKVLKCRAYHTSERLDNEVINIMSREINKLDYAVATCHELYRAPIEAVLIGFYVYREAGVGGLLGIVLILAFVPLLFYIIKKANAYRSRAAHHTEERVRLMGKIIKRIEDIKIFCMEQVYALMIKDRRNEEIDMVRGSLYLRATSISLNFILKLSIFVCIVSVLNMNKHLSVSSVYVIISYYTMLFTSILQFWPHLVRHANDSYEAVKKIQNLLIGHKRSNDVGDDKREKQGGENETLLMKEKTLERTINEESEIKSVSIKNVKGALFNCDRIDINETKCHVIIGDSSTSSSFFQLLLGEVDENNNDNNGSDGEIEINGGISYASKDGWIFPGSIRENILFTEKFDNDRYISILKLTQLDKDIESLPVGDDTFINKASTNEIFRCKISLARCIYRDADIYLLDNCFAMFTDGTAKTLFKDIAKKFLKDKIVIASTESYGLLREADNIIAINENKVHFVGSLRDFRRTNLFEQLIPKSHVQDAEESSMKIFERSSSTESSQSIQEKSSAHRSSLVIHQIPVVDYSENEVGENVEWESYRKYLKSISRSKCGISWLVILFICAQINASGLELFIAKWFNNHDDEMVPSRHVLSVNFTEISSANNSLRESEAFASNYDNWVNFIYFYSIILCTLLYFTVHRSFLFFKLCLRASVCIHDKLFCGVTRATLRFFKCNSLRHILSYFTTDMEAMDVQLPTCSYDSIMFLFETIGICVLIALVNYWLLLPTLIMLLTVLTLRYFYVDTSRSLRRIESLTYNSIYSRITSTFQGLSTIHSTHSERVLMDEFHKNMDLNTSAIYLNFATTRAFALWLDIICSIYICLVILSFVLLPSGSGGGAFKSGDVGMAITQALHLLFFLQWGIRQTVEVGNQMTSVERIFEYENINMEAPLRTPNKYRPSKTWPQVGKVVFTNFHLRYSPNGYDVLKDINFKINQHEKVGIVGAKSSGKSSIVRALQRFAINEGSIEIDDINIDTLGLHDLRRSFGVIPSHPILFEGSIRCNLDPLQQHTDDEIWSVLERVDMKSIVGGIEGALSATPDERMFSIKQMQLLYIARALLANTKILILDETTEKLQITDENEIQDVIRRNFYDSTVIAITEHRLSAVMDCDKVIVLEDGRIVEIGHPYELIQISRGVFRAMVDKMGYMVAMNLIKISEKSYFNKKNNTTTAVERKNLGN